MKSRSMTGLIFGAVFILCATVVEPGFSASASPANFDKRKSQQLRRIDARMTRLQDERVCVQRAATQDDIMKCRETFRAGNKQPAK
jgi:hypothetical protein